ncbi:MAG: hypothetical protein ACYDCO_01360 [Armatimonadota bacterium]
MKRSLWIILCAGIGVLALSGCGKKAPTVTVPATINKASSSASQGTGQTPKTGTPSGHTATPPVQPERPVATNPEKGRQAPFAVWWNSLSVEERDQFNKLPPEERQKKMREVLGK